MKKFIVLIVAFLLSTSCFAQLALPGSCKTFLPNVLSSTGSRSIHLLSEEETEKLGSSADFGQKGPKTNEYWQVLSDRDENAVYQSPTSNSVIGKVSFNDELVIAEIKDGRALVFKSSHLSKSDYPKMPNDAVCVGWIPMSNLLLWDSCPTDKFGIYNKALISLNLEASGLKNAKNIVGKLFGNPANVTKYEPLETDKRFYFIMKREGSMVLLATQYTVSAGYSKKVLFGWVAEGSYVPWNQRTCLEPTWSEEDVAYFSDKGIKANIYRLPKDNKPVTWWDYTNQNEKIKKKQQNRLPGGELRFPLLAWQDGKYYISSFGTSNGGDVSDGPIADGKSMGLAEETLRQLSQINICVVIDGTASMKDYYPAVKEAIKECCSNFSNGNYKIKVGALIYRDQQDKIGSTSYEIESINLTSPNNTMLSQFFDNAGDGKYGCKSSSADKTAEESLFWGMSKALDMLKGHEKESNIMIVVGDCGNNPNDKRIDEKGLLEKFINQNVQLIVAQVADKSQPIAYGTFKTQLSRVLRENIMSKYAKLDARTGGSPSKVILKEGQGEYFYDNDASSNIYVGQFSFPKKANSQMTPTELTKAVVSSVDKLGKSIQTQLDIIVRSQSGSGWKGTGGSAGTVYDAAFVEEMTGEKPVSGVIMSFRGYTDKERDSRQLYKPVMFISSDELKTLVQKLEPVAREANHPTADRSKYVDGLKTLIRSYVPDLTPEEMAKMSQEEIMRIAAGLVESSSATKEHTIAEINDAHRVSQNEYVSILTRFARNFKKLQRIPSSNYEYVTEFNGAKYYWIPVEDLP